MSIRPLEPIVDQLISVRFESTKFPCECYQIERAGSELPPSRTTRKFPRLIQVHISSLTKIAESNQADRFAEKYNTTPQATITIPTS